MHRMQMLNERAKQSTMIVYRCVWLILLFFAKWTAGLRIGPQPRRVFFDSLVKEGAVVATTSTAIASFPHLSLATENDLAFDVFQVIPDASESLDPSLVALKKETFLNRIVRSKGGAIWLGEHHNAARDHNVQTEILRRVHELSPKSRPMAVGLEQIQVNFQTSLNDYIAGKVSILEMKQQVEWDTRWTWPFETYQPIFETARELQIPLIALNVNSEDLALVERNGFPGLPREQMLQYIRDPQGFADFAKGRRFSTYVNYVIRPSYDLHEAMGLLKNTMSGEKLDEPMPFRNFLSGRILWDEAMAANAYAWTLKNPTGLLFGLVGSDHVKFQSGIPGRYSRMCNGEQDCLSVMINPTLIDSRPSGTVAFLEGADSSRFPDKLTLQLRYLKDDVDADSQERRLASSTGGVMPLADYIVVG